MKCKSCDVVLNDCEATRKYASNPKEYIDLCNNCFKAIADDVAVIEGKGTNVSQYQETSFEE